MPVGDQDYSGRGVTLQFSRYDCTEGLLCRARENLLADLECLQKEQEMARKFDPERVEAAAAAIGLVLGPQDGCSRWTEAYRPQVKWPDSYSEHERSKLREAAACALLAASKI